MPSSWCAAQVMKTDAYMRSLDTAQGKHSQMLKLVAFEIFALNPPCQCLSLTLHFLSPLVAFQACHFVGCGGKAHLKQSRQLQPAGASSSKVSLWLLPFTIALLQWMAPQWTEADTARELTR